MMALAIDAGSPGSASDRGAARGLRHGGDVGRHDRAAARHGLEDRQAERLVERRVHEDVRRPVEADGFLQRHAADEHDVVGDAELGGERVQRRPGTSRPVRCRRSPAGGPPSSAAGHRPGPQQPVAVLVRPQRRDEQHERLGHAVGGLTCAPGPRRRRRAGTGRGRPPRRSAGACASSTSRYLLDLGAQALGVDDDGVGEPPPTAGS